MSKTVVIYKSKYGSTKKYAEWIAKATSSNLFEKSQISIQKLKDYDTIVYGGGLYVSGIIGFSIIKDNYDKLKDKKIIVFSVGASPAREEALEEVKKKNFTDDMRSNINYFHLRGGLDYKSMNVKDRFLMYLLNKMIKKKKPEELDEDSKGLLATYGKTVDFTSEKYIQPIVDCIQSLQ